jgi:helicase-like protein
MKLSNPEVVAVKHGGHINFKPKNIQATLIINEIKEFIKAEPVKVTSFFGEGAGHLSIQDSLKESLRLPIYHVLSLSGIDKMTANDVQTSIETTPLFSLFNSYGIKVTIDTTLVNYIMKEYRRQKLERTHYPTIATSTDLPLFERCTVGTNLLCIKDFKPASLKNPLFTKGNRYMVVDTGDEIDKVTISTNQVQAGATVQLTGNGAKFEWTLFDDPMEDWFDDSTQIESSNKNIRELYPERILQMEKRLKAQNLVLYDHVKEDVVAQALHRGVMNCYVPRLAKTSSAIATAELMGSTQVGVLTTKNISIFWEKEFKRLGMTNYVMVKTLSDLDKPSKYYVMTYNFLRSQVDQTEKPRKNHNNYLKKDYKETSKKEGKKVVITKVPLFNLCPHCEKKMVRPIYNVDEAGNRTLVWEEAKGYMCRNKKCTYTTDNSKALGAAWQRKTAITHKAGSYIDYGLARHAKCPEGSVKGRQCTSCGETDGVWRPAVYKRLMKRFTCVIADEIHNAKSIDTQTANATFNLRARRRIGLTGTPMSNSAMDIYYPFHWAFKANTTMFPYAGKEGAKQFEDDFCQHIYLEKPTGDKDETGKDVTKTIKKRVPFLANPTQFWQFIGSKVVRRTYSDPLYQQALINAGMKQPKTEIKKLVCAMHPAQTALMLSALENFKDQFAEMVEDATKNKKELNEALVISQMSALRTIATSPERINERLGKIAYEGPAGGGKIDNIFHIVKGKIDAGEKVVILSDSLDMQKACEAKLKEYGTIRFQTGWDTDQREEAFDDFANNSKKRVFIAGTRTVREGVDLSSANSVICCDLLWAPAFQMQAWSRTMAPTKEDRTCEVYLVLSKNSIDEHMFDVFYSKMTAAEQAFDKKVLSRRAQVIDIKFFVDRVLEDRTALNMQVRDYDDNAIYVPSMNLEAFGERF